MGTGDPNAKLELWTERHGYMRDDMIEYDSMRCEVGFFMAAEKFFSLWLMPTGDAYHALANLIFDLSKEYSSPRFAPHVTLLGELHGSEEEIRSRTSRLSANLKPYAIDLTRIEYLDEYSRSLFIRVEETEQVMQTNLRARSIFDRQRGPKYMPHLSILYGNFASTTKDEVIEKIGREFRLSFEVKSLHLVETSTRPENWFTAKEFPFESNPRSGRVLSVM